MSVVQFYKTNVLPALPEPNAFYYVQNGDIAESYLTTAGGQIKAVGNSEMINSAVADSMEQALSQHDVLEIVETIEDRDALQLTRNVTVFVVDALGDPGANGGPALYAYSKANDVFLPLTNQASGGDDKHHVHKQDTPMATWTVTHNLGKYPSVTVVDSAGTFGMSEIHYLNENRVELKFAYAFSGKAYFN